jgi:hypothetical protein
MSENDTQKKLTELVELTRKQFVAAVVQATEGELKILFEKMQDAVNGEDYRELRNLLEQGRYSIGRLYDEAARAITQRRKQKIAIAADDKIEPEKLKRAAQYLKLGPADDDDDEVDDVDEDAE